MNYFANRTFRKLLNINWMFNISIHSKPSNRSTQRPPFTHGSLTHQTRVSHLFPVKSHGQKQVKSFHVTVHSPPFKQGSICKPETQHQLFPAAMINLNGSNGIRATFVSTYLAYVITYASRKHVFCITGDKKSLTEGTIPDFHIQMHII